MSYSQFHAPPLTKINKYILICTGACFLLDSILKAVGAFSLTKVLGLSANGFFHGLIYQLLTYPFVEVHLMNFIFNGLVVWFIGSELEGQWGKKVYLRFLIFTVIFVGLTFALVNLIFFFGTPSYFTSLQGLSGVNFALLVAYSLLYPDRPMAFMMIFPMKAKVFCWILLGIEAHLALFSSFSASWAHLIAMFSAFLMIRFQNGPFMSKIFHFSLKSHAVRKKHLYVVKEEDKNPPKYWQ
jgi:membrane associated rhomboid family serine protease